LKFVARHHAARCLKCFSSTESQMASASCTDTSITGRPPTDRRSRLPPVDPISLAGTPAARARSSNTDSRGRDTDTTTRDADSENNAARSEERRVGKEWRCRGGTRPERGKGKEV